MRLEKEELLRLQAGGRDPGTVRVPGFGSVISNCTGRWVFFCMKIEAWADTMALEHIANVKPYKVACAQLTVDGEVEQRKFPGSIIQLQSNPHGRVSLAASAVASGRSASLCSTAHDTPVSLGGGVGNGIH